MTDNPASPPFGSLPAAPPAAAPAAPQTQADFGPRGQVDDEGVTHLADSPLHMTPERLANLRDAYLAAGGDPARWDASVTASGRPLPIPELAPPLGASEDVKARARYYSRALSDGIVPVARVLELAAQDGLIPDPTPDTRSAEARAFDASPFAPAGSPNDYAIDPYGVLPRDMPAEHISALSEGAATLMHGLGMPQKLGSSVGRMMLQAALDHIARSAEAREAHERIVAKQLDAVTGGPEQTEALAKRVNDALNTIDDPELVAAFREAGAFSNPNIVIAISQQLDLLERRKAMK